MILLKKIMKKDLVLFGEMAVCIGKLFDVWIMRDMTM